MFYGDKCDRLLPAGHHGLGLDFWGLPTALWFLPNPLILNNGPSFGVKTNLFGFIISWATNISVVVEACTNLANPTWSPVNQHPHRRLVLFQRSAVDELSRAASTASARREVRLRIATRQQTESSIRATANDLPLASLVTLLSAS